MKVQSRNKWGVIWRHLIFLFRGKNNDFKKIIRALTQYQ